MAARLVSSIMTILQLRGCSSRYFLTVFLDSPTLMARRISPLSASSWPILSTKAASSAQKPHQVVQNSRRTTLPLMDSLVNFSPVVVVALKRGAGSLSLGPASAQRDARIKEEESATRTRRVRGMTREIYHKGRVVGQHHYWYRAPRSEPQEDSRTTCRYWERARSMEKAPEPLMMMARATANVKRWYSKPSPFWVP